MVFGEEDLKKTVALDADGTFDFPYVGRVKAGGLTPRRIGEDIAAEAEVFCVNAGERRGRQFPQPEGLRLGYMCTRPGSIRSRHHAVLEVLAAAGSPTPTAAGSYAVVSRPSGMGPGCPRPRPAAAAVAASDVEGAAGRPGARNGLLFATATPSPCPKAETVFVIGHVKTPGPCDLKVT